MKEDKNDIDQFFKDQLESREFDVPASFVEDLENRLDKKLKRPPFYLNFWFLSALLIFVGSLSAVIYYNFPDQSNTQSETNLSETNPTNDASKNIASNDTAPENNQNIVEGDDLNKNDSNITQNNNIESYANETQNNDSQKTENNSNTPQMNNNKSSESKKTLPNNQTPTKNENMSPQNTGNKTGDAKNKNNSTDEKNSNTTSNSGKTNENEVPKEKKSEDESEPSKKNEESKNNNTPPSPDEEDTLKNNKDTLKIEKVITRDSIIFKDSIIIRDSIVIKDSLVIRDSVVMIKKSDVSDWGYELQAYGGFGMVRKSIKTTDSDYQNALENGETNMNTPSLGFNFNVNYKKWSLSTGLGYYQTGEDYSFESTDINTYDSIYFSYNDTVIDYTVITDSLGNQTVVPVDTNYYPVYDTTTISDTTVESFNNQNLYTWLTIPISFGHEFKFGSWALIPRVGANFSIGLSQNNGVYPTINNEYQEIQAVKFGMSYMLQLEIRKEFEYFHIYLSPFYRNRFQPSVTTPNMDRKYSIFGINGGIGVKF